MRKRKPDLDRLSNYLCTGDSSRRTSSCWALSETLFLGLLSGKKNPPAAAVAGKEIKKLIPPICTLPLPPANQGLATTTPAVKATPPAHHSTQVQRTSLPKQSHTMNHCPCSLSHPRAIQDMQTKYSQKSPSTISISDF